MRLINGNFCLIYSESLIKRYCHLRGKLKYFDLKFLILSIDHLALYYLFLLPEPLFSQVEIKGVELDDLWRFFTISKYLTIDSFIILNIQ